MKSARQGCPERLYDTFSAFANQDDGGVIVFGLDEKSGFAQTGVYDAQNLQTKLMEVGEQMTPIVRPVLSICQEDGLTFVSAEITPLDLVERPCFKTAKGRLKGSYIRVGDGDKPMTEYEVYSYEAYRKKYREDIQTVENTSAERLEQYLLKRKASRPNLSAIPLGQLYELTGITKGTRLTLSAILLFSPYPQAYFPQLSILAARVPGMEMRVTGPGGERFLDSRRVDGKA